MDKVTQQVAANSEESASASEELSAQATQMQSVVGDLASLMSGSSGLNGNGTQWQIGARNHTTVANHAPATGKPASRNAEVQAAIPFDGDQQDFIEF